MMNYFTQPLCRGKSWSYLNWCAMLCSNPLEACPFLNGDGGGWMRSEEMGVTVCVGGMTRRRRGKWPVCEINEKVNKIKFKNCNVCMIHRNICYSEMLSISILKNSKRNHVIWKKDMSFQRLLKKKNKAKRLYWVHKQWNTHSMLKMLGH